VGHEHASTSDPDERDGDQHLPAQPHDLVVAIARERGAEPQEQEQEEEQLDRQPVGAGQRQQRDLQQAAVGRT
jgi:hypothetical protein